MPQVSSVVVYDNLSRSNYNLFIGLTKLDKRFRLMEGDVLDSRKLRRAVADADVVYHLAAKVTTPFAHQDPHLFEQVNHWGTAEVCYAVEASSVSKLIYASSAVVYGAGGVPADLTTTPAPDSFYGISKWRGEQHVARLAPGTEVVIFRCANVYGYNRSLRIDAVINKFMFEANFSGKINVHGDGSQRRPFVFIDTVADVFAEALTMAKHTGTHNLVEDNFRVSDLVDVVRTLYPQLETIFIGHNMPLRELVVEADETQENALERLRQRLENFKSQFTF